MRAVRALAVGEDPPEERMRNAHHALFHGARDTEFPARPLRAARFTHRRQRVLHGIRIGQRHRVQQARPAGRSPRRSLCAATRRAASSPEVMSVRASSAAGETPAAPSQTTFHEQHCYGCGSRSVAFGAGFGVARLTSPAVAARPCR